VSARRVLHLIETDGPGGAETVLADLLLRADPARIAATAIIPADGGWLTQHLPADKRVYATPSPPARSGPVDVAYIRLLRDIVARERPDLVHAHSFDSALYGALALRGRAPKLIASFHGASDVARRGWKNRLKWHAIRRVDAIVCVSRALAAQARATPGVRPSHVRTIHNGIDLTQYHATRHSRLRTKLGLGPDTIILGALGNIRLPKGYTFLLDAIALLRADGQDVHLAIAGDDRFDPTPALRTQCERLGLTSHVTLLGFIDDAPEFLHGIDCFVLSSLSEGFSISTVQGMACALPVVATRCGGPEEIIEDNVSGVLVAAGSAAALADGIGALLADAPRRTRLATAAQERARALFSVEAMLDAYEQVYAEVAAK